MYQCNDTGQLLGSILTILLTCPNSDTLLCSHDIVVNDTCSIRDGLLS